MTKTKKRNKGIGGLSVDMSLSLEEQIAHRAQEIWKKGGCRCGDDLADWFLAEREIMEHHYRQQTPVRSQH